jgi:hypothetical protein
MDTKVAAQRQCVSSLDDLPADIVDNIRSLLFDSNGCLRRDVTAGIPGTLAEIKFPYGDKDNGEVDARWQISLPRENTGELYIHVRSPRHSSKQTCITHSFHICFTDLWAAVETALKTYYESSEVAFELSLIVAGTKHQPFHTDAVRKKPKKRTKKANVDPDGRLPLPMIGRSVLIALNDSRTIFLGVQKKDCDILSLSQCVVRRSGFRPVPFSFVVQTEDMIIIEGRNAFLFDGDFPHAGVSDINESTLCEQLVQQLRDSIPYTGTNTHGPLFEVLYNFPGLNRVCRLHIATTITGGQNKIVKNKVGFLDCVSNKATPKLAVTSDHLHLHKPPSSVHEIALASIVRTVAIYSTT